MAAGIDVGVDPDGDAGAGAASRCDRVDPFELPFRLGVDTAQAEIDGAGELGVGLADPGEDDLSGSETGPQCDLDFPARVGIGGGAERAQQAGDAQRGIGLQCVVEGVRIARERFDDLPVTCGDGRGAVT